MTNFFKNYDNLHKLSNNQNNGIREAGLTLPCMSSPRLSSQAEFPISRNAVLILVLWQFLSRSQFVVGNGVWTAGASSAWRNLEDTHLQIIDCCDELMIPAVASCVRSWLLCTLLKLMAFTLASEEGSRVGSAGACCLSEHRAPHTACNELTVPGLIWRPQCCGSSIVAILREAGTLPPEYFRSRLPGWRQQHDGPGWHQGCQDSREGQLLDLKPWLFVVVVENRIFPRLLYPHYTPLMPPHTSQLPLSSRSPLLLSH